MKKYLSYLFLLVLAISSKYLAAQDIYITKSAEVGFTSNAPLELIQAKAKQLSGILDIFGRSFVFSVPINSFQGFNSPLQRTHFNENYMESNLYPKAKFDGKIIEEIDLKKDGKYSIRAKGKLTIHGVEKIQTLRCEMTVKGGEIKVVSDFIVFLNDYNIKIPTVVSQKISEEINVKVDAVLTQKK